MMIYNTLYKVIILLLFFLATADCQCTWPSPFVSSTWRNNAEGDLVFHTTTMTGWSFTVGAETVGQWQCVNTEQFVTDGYLILRSLTDFTLFARSYYAYLCLKMTAVTDVSYRVYIKEPKQSNLYEDRYYVHTSSDLTDVSTICLEQYGATGSEYQVMIRSGSESLASITCPWVFLGRFDYSHIDVSGTTTCSTSGDTWDMCTDKTNMAWDFTSCSTDVAYSALSNVQCIDTVPVGGDSVVTVYTSATVDGTNTYSFACFAVSAALDQVSVAPQFCRQDQTSSAYPQDKYGNQLGAQLTIANTYELCPTCPELDHPDGGTVTVETDGAWTVASYVCAENYALYGDVTQTCQQNNTWSGAPPTCKCIAPANPANGNVTVSVDGDQASYTCNVGYVLVGNEIRVCQVDGNAWNGTDPICETCSEITSISNGAVTMSQQGGTTLASFTCNVGYTLSGETDITCLTNGTWSAPNPTCALCATLTPPDLGNFTLATDGHVTMATFTCQTGYQVQGTEALTCDTGGTWDSDEPTCICTVPVAPAHGSVNLSTDGLTVIYACDNGYTLDGTAASTCLMNGSSWSTPAPTCVPCAELTTPDGGNVTMTTNGTVTMATYVCQAGYNLIGVSIVQCTTDGTWSDTTTTCVACETLNAPDGGTVAITTDGHTSIAQYSCSSDYVLQGSANRTCQSDGTWDGTRPTCACESPATPTNGGVTVEGGVASYSCDVNHTLVGGAVSYCSTDGTGWNSTQPNCVLCESLSDPTGGSVQFVSISGQYTQASYTCDAGYTLAGSANVVCGSDGKWNSTDSTCVECQAIPAIAHGSVTVATDGLTSSATFTCDVGHTLGEGHSPQSECREDGTWTTATVTCTSCDAVNNISSGQVTMTTNGTVTMVTYTCVSGYDLVGAVSRSCMSDGTWTEEEPVCVCETPASIADGSVSLSADRLTATYSCDTGFTMNGNTTAICQTDGTGWNSTPPTCVVCVSLSHPPDGNVTLTSDGIITMATYTCVVGYSLDGSIVQTCLSDGSWSLQQPSCVSCITLTDPSSGSLSLSTNGSHSVASLTCLQGYRVVGSQQLVCQQDGTWHTDTPTCVCENPDPPANGNVSVSVDGYTAVYTCDTGYTLNDTTTRTCLTEGQGWSGQTPYCVSCEAIPADSGGSTTQTSNGTITQVEYTCTAGYTLTGDQTRTCGTDGQWSGHNSSCTACTSLEEPTSGSVTMTTDGTMTTATYTCSDGYYVHGLNVSLCNTDGTWTNLPPTCVCVLPSVPTNGSMDVSADNVTLTFTCDTGYVLSGSSERTCQTDGTGWSGTQPSCTTCAALDVPGNGTVTLTSDGDTTSAQFSCNVGYSLHGVSVLTCDQQGTWSDQAPLCVGCPSISDLPSGTVTVTTNGTVSMATFSCTHGYHIVGSTSVTCLTTGVWDGEVPECVCDVPAAPDNGNLTVSTNGMEVSYVCDTGTTLSGPVVRRCATNGTGWDGTDPQCVSCQGLSSPTGGSVSTSTDGQTTVTVYSCDLGYTINGSTTLTCTSSGNWDNNQPNCVQCTSLSSPDSGALATTTNSTVTIATVTCDTGYNLIGQPSLTCLVSGSWDMDTPTCVCKPPSTPTNGAFTLTADGMTVTYMCSTGYTLLGVSTRLCQTDGTGWNEIQPSCTTCEVLPSLSGGNITMVTSGTVTQAVFICEAGYTISGSTSATCRSDGSWDISAPSCGVCESVSSPAGGSVSVTSDGSVSVATYTCDLGYSLNGPATLTCRTDGSWDMGPPTCAQCSTLASPNSGSVTMTTNNTVTIATFTCTAGYYVSGETVVTCGADGTWNSAEPTCVCSSEEAPDNGSLVLSADGLMVTYSCDVGTVMVGSQTSVCTNNGTGWSAPAPTCVSCPALSSVEGGSVDTVTNGTHTVASVTCDVGSSLSGDASSQCSSNGTWTYTQPTCVSCPSVTSPDNGTVTVTTDGMVTMATYSCNLGYTMAGELSSSCLTDGNWDQSPPSCVPCDTLADVPSGSVVLSMTGSVTIATYTCSSGYFLSGDQTVVCLSDGSWNSSQPQCVCDAPVAPVSGSIWVSPDGMWVTYSCDVGYTLQGTTNNTCATDGSGWALDHPTCVACQPSSAPLYGNVTQYTDGSTTYTIYTCTQGYTLNSPVAIATCSDTGQWDLSSLSCVQCSTLSDPNSGTVEISTSGSVSQATYTCTAGYYIHGNSQRTCLTDGSWNGTESTCECSTPASPSNGGVTVSADLQSATYTCDTGYSRDGVSVRLCASDGTGWTENEPTCTICETLASVGDGSVSMSSDGQTTVAIVSCDVGYTMVGSAHLQCRSDGSWNVTMPTCVLCDPVTFDPSAGSYSLSTDGESSAVIFECEPGYTLSGSTEASCTTSGTWTQTTPSCVTCATLAAPDSGSVTLSTNGTITSAVYTCVSGYYVVGDSNLSCDSSGNWSSTTPTCVCDIPSAPENGTVTVQDGGYTAVYTCTQGLSLSGTDTRTCSTDGQGWNGTQPSCVACDPVPILSHGSLELSTDGVQTTVTITCEQGYTATGPVQLTCQSDGTYNTTWPTCAECSNLEDPSNGTVVLSTTGSVTMATFTCDLEFVLSGNQILSCQSDGSWSEASPSCELCDSFPAINSGSYTLTTNGTATSATVQCETGYSLHGSSPSLCTATGVWTEVPSCLCDAPPTPTNGQVTSDGIQAVYTCDQGYTLSGAPVAVCNTDGSGWNSSTPACVECETLSSIQNGADHMTTDGSVTSVTFTCPVGYSLSGQSQVSCNSDGTWSADVPTCSSCDTLTSPDSGTVSMETDNTTTTAVYSCMTGYDLLGVSVRTCVSSGTWSDTPPTCVCSVPETPQHGSVSVSADRTTVDYSCIAGYTLTGAQTRTCQANGAGWTGTQPSCTVCSTLSISSGGDVSIATDGTMTTATFTCGSGYTIDGAVTLTCRDDGTWNVSEPICVVCDSVESISGGGYSVSTDGHTSRLEYTCTEGYTLSGSTELSCQSSGHWSGQAPTCVSCPAVLAPDSGSVDLSTTGTVTVATYTCVAGYYLYGAVNLTCLASGLWDLNPPTCRCNLPPNITSGYYVASDDDSLLTYVCSEGYSLNGSLSQTCSTEGLSWSGSQPTCVQCQEVSSITGGTSMTVTNGTVTVTTYQCDLGSSLQGQVSSECIADGTWTATTPTCVSCSALVSPSNGNVTMTTNGTVSMGTYTCDLGYTMAGDGITHCLTEGVWSSSQPACSECASLGSVSSGSYVLTTDGVTTTGSYTCTAGYQLTSPGLLTCRSDGTWDLTAPTCVCEPPLSVVNGNYTISDDGLSVSYTCDLGFTMSGSPDRSCDSAGAGWSDSPPTCSQCDSLPVLENGAVSYTTDGVSTTVTYTCGTGYAVSDVMAITAVCMENGTWNVAANTTPSCVSCSTLESIANGNITMTTDGIFTIATYSCWPDYDLTGNSQRTCIQGNWNGSSPACVCAHDSYFANGQVASNGSVVMYTCNSGYTLDGPESRTCQDAGQGWSLTQPTCVVCESLSPSDGGRMTLETGGTVTTANFTCDQGYTLTGQILLTCRSDGTWDTSPPSCGNSCSSLSQPSDGTVALETDGYVTIATYSCDAGYSLVGMATLTCRSDGSWDFTESSCAGCGAVTAPASGFVAMTTDGYTSVATFTCNTDYYRVGTNQTTCLTNGTWSDTLPTCVCNPPSSPANGNVTLSETGMVASFTCTQGYTLQGTNTTTCQTDATGWEPYTVQCVSCSELPVLSDGTVTMSTDGQSTSVLVTCDVGYSVDGEASLSCTQNGTWSTTLPQCVNCPTLADVQNGSYTLATDGLITSAQFLCNVGFTIKGDNLLTCSSSGTWSHSAPECVECVGTGTPASGSVQVTTDGWISAASFTCLDGYQLVGDTTLICLTDGTWNGTQPACVCDSPAAPAHGQVDVSSEGLEAHYTCDSGYTLHGEPLRQCSEQGAGWMGESPTCVQCEALSAVENGSYSVSTNGTTTVVSYSCGSGYTQTGTAEGTCTSNGTWDLPTSPTCVLCVELSSPDSGHVTISTNGSVSTAVYGCDTGYFLQGVTVRMCTDLGTWDGLQPSCECESPGSPLHGDVSSDGTLASYTCDVGYTLYGEPVRSCQGNSLGWNGTQPECQACTTLSSVSGGMVSMVTDGTSTSAAYTCDQGYTMSGSSTITCRSDGTWDFTDTTCVSCSALLVPSQGEVTLMSDGSTTSASVTCGPGYSLSGSSNLTCRSDGTWDFTEPNCVGCPSLSDPASGQVNLTTDGLISTAVYTCVSGYHSNGVTSRTCDTDGTWSGQAPTCWCDSPATPVNGSLVLSEDEMTATFTCHTGTTLMGSTVLACQQDGTGWSGAQPTCVGCGEFEASFNGTVTMATDGQTTVATLACDLGSTLSGTTEISCSTNGTWEIQSTPNCVTCEALTNPVGGSISMETNGTETLATYSCDVGYTMSGNSTLYCTDTGLWDRPVPVCNLCSEIVTPTSGTISQTTDDYTTVAMVTCNLGYHVVGSNPISCLQDGSWSNDVPLCVCDVPGSPDNGQTDVSTDGVMATFTCDVGFTLNGSLTAACQSDGSSWDNNVPVCVSCTSLANISDGGVSLTTNGSVTIATYSCSEGHSLLGNRVRECGESGAWILTAPTCVPCPSLESPTSGSVSLGTNGSHSRASYSCEAGYYLQGTSESWCTAESGEWTTQQPTCICEVPNPPDHGTVSVADDSFIAVYTCDVGYTLKGLTHRYCLGDGSGWNSTAPTCVTCETLPSLAGALSTVTTDGSTTSVQYGCDVGYTLQGTPNLTCRDDGTWDTQAPTCVTCATLSTPVGGQVTLNTDGSSTAANITCDTGYTLSGSTTLTCRSDGTWDFSVPTCSQCPSLTDPFGGSVTMATDGHVTMATYFCLPAYYLDGVSVLSCDIIGTWNDSQPQCKCTPPAAIPNGEYQIPDDGSSVTYSCLAGHTLSGDSNQTCLDGGAGWSGTSPTCVECEAVSAVANGSYTMTTDSVTSTVTFSCDTGYTLSGETAAGCLTNGSWEYSPPTCVQCSSLDLPVNGSYVLDSNGNTTVAVIQCDQGYSLSGHAVLTCLNNGTWSANSPTCVTCPQLNPPLNGDVVVTTNGSITMATFTCDLDYVLSGSDQLQCDQQGLWNGIEPTCDCEAFVTPNHGGLLVSSNGTTASYSCEAGFTLSGSPTLQCGALSDVTPPTCVSCSTLSSSAGASFSYSTNGSITMATYTCDTGYTMIGQNVITCHSDGSWDSEAPSCAPCSSLSVLAGASVNMTSTGEVTLAVFQCDLGYSIVGTHTLTCRTDGAWDFNTPTCVKCPDLSAPLAGSISMTTDGITSMADYSCVAGYHVDGAARLTCNTSGLWDNQLPVCKCDMVASVVNGSEELSADGFTVIYTCSLGYTLDGTVNRSCDPQGTGWSAEDPECVLCDTLTLPANLSAVLETDGVTTSVRYTCDQPYSMSGTALSTCLSDGSWSEATPTCVSCPSLESPANGTISYSTDGIHTVTGYQCSVGYTLVGEATLTCNSNGSWSATPPTCVSCLSLTGTNNGDISMTTNGTVTIATLTCDQGYSVAGSPVLQCTQTGTWDQTQPQCACDAFTSVANGALTVSDNGTTATYTCSEGYTMSGESVITCPTPGSIHNTSAPACTVCGSLSTPAGSVVTLDTDGQTTTAHIQCDAGYTLSGQDNLTCRADGTWDINMPTCVVCSTLTEPVGGTVTMTTNGSITVARFTCDLGYTVSGSDQLTCRADGSWDITEPTCVQCQTLEIPNSGNITMTTTSYVTMATFSCFHGYYLDGTTTLTCQESGEWSDVIPVCKCEELPSLANGSVTLSTDGMMAIYTCDTGYTLMGGTNRSCDTAGSGWLGDTPTCVACVDIVASENMNVTMTTDGTITMVTYQCESGSSLNGQVERTCGTDGTWTGQQPTCDQCAELAAPDNGVVSIVTNGTLTQTEFTCDHGYSLSGDTTLTCDPGGIWSASPPTCVSCPVLVAQSNGFIETFTNGTVTMATYSCSPGYSISGDSSLYCTGDGSWNNSPPTCACDAFTTVGNGALTVSDNGTTATYTCSEGYTMSGESVITCPTPGSIHNTSAPACTVCSSLSTPAGSVVTLDTDGQTTTAHIQCDTGYTLSGQDNLTCRADGTWDINMPTCVVCSTLTEPVGGTVAMTTNGSITVARFTCDLGYTVSGSDQLTCRADGSWDITEPTCAQCPSLESLDSGNITMTTSSYVTIATFSCFHGYYLDGTMTLTCLESGEWSDVTPVCKCEELPSLANGSVTLSTDGMMTTYTCDTGYTLMGGTNRSCDTAGSGWLGDTPTCVACVNIVASENMNVTMTTDGTITMVTYQCESGSSLNGQVERTCGTDGTWTGQQPTCDKCAGLAAPDNGVVSIVTNATLTQAEFTCDHGYSLSGDTTLTCDPGGIWSASPPTCVFCPVLVAPSNGFIDTSTNGTVTMATYSCNTGYSIAGDSSLYCTDNGSWNSSPPTCACDAFTTVTNGALTVSDNGTTATYTCSEGYTMSGESVITCPTPGSIHNTSAPACSVCSSLSTPAGSVVSLDTNGQTTTAHIQCDAGYTLSGQDNLTCRADGTWDINMPTCVVCSTLTEPVGGTVTMTTNGSITVARFTCDLGYTVSGSDQLTCRADGSWDITEPTCVQCPSLESPNSGNITMTTSSYVTMATFSCFPGYYLDGTMTLTCLEGGDWSDLTPVCKCEELSVLANGNVTLSTDGMMATYTCNTGYTLMGGANRSCDTAGSGWLGDTPICVACVDIVASENMNVTMTTDGTITMVTYQCETGSSLNGQAERTCGTDGNWTGQQPTCDQCTILANPDHGVISMVTSGTLTKAEFTCDHGYSLTGETSLTCDPRGTWSDAPSTCVTCPVLTASANGVIQTSTNGTVTMATVTCNPGYSAEGEVALYCTSNGTWSNSPPTCRCDIFEQPTNGELTISSNGTTATYTCDLGYTLNGEPNQSCEISSSASSTSYTRSCVLCETLTTGPGSQFTLSTDGTQTVASFTCDTGYRLAGQQLLSCREDGTWDVSSPTCVVCDALTSPPGGNVTVTSNGTMTWATYTCVLGFTLQGQGTLTCTANGTWDFLPPSCDCDEPPTPTNGMLTLSEDGLTASYTCNVGYTLSGSPTLQCNVENNGWQGEAPACVSCPTLEIDHSLNVTLLSDGVMTSAVVLCDHGYTLSYTSNITCQANGSWSPELPICVSCPSIDTTSGLSFVLQSDGRMTKADFTCGAGHSVNGAGQIACSRNGSWNMDQPTCVAVTGEQDGGEGSGAETAVAIVFAILFAIALILLLLLAWRFYKLRQQWKLATKSNLYKAAPKFPTDNGGRLSMMSLPELDEIVLTNPTAPRSHIRHVTDLGRATSSLAPSFHSKGIFSSASVLSNSPAPLSHKGLEPQRPPKSHGRASPNPAIGEPRVRTPLPQQILTLTSSDMEIQSLIVPKIGPMKSGKPSKAQGPTGPNKGSANGSKLFDASKLVVDAGSIPREGSPLPQQILTPRDPDMAAGSSPYSHKKKITGKQKRKATGAAASGTAVAGANVSGNTKSAANSGRKQKSKSATPGVQTVSCADADYSLSDLEC